MTSVNEYASVLPVWQMELAIRRIRAWRFRGADFDDAFQEVMLALIGHVYDPQNWHGATEKQAAFSVIERRLAMLWRAEKRYRQRVERWSTESRATDRTPGSSIDSLPLDLSTMIAEMPERTRHVCMGLLHGESLNEIAIRLHTSWGAVRREVTRIRRVLQRAGLEPKNAATPEVLP